MKILMELVRGDFCQVCNRMKVDDVPDLSKIAFSKVVVRRTLRVGYNWFL